MKGPFERLKYDLRRVWECPVCHRQARTPGTGTASLCACQQQVALNERQWMKLVHDGPLRLGNAGPPRPNAT
ncbi:MAG: hypothetical protein K8T25_15445 [Planctomycetia bacterium]|nr:hypothetical protein [Planctomycetia bacterium]